MIVHIIGSDDGDGSVNLYYTDDLTLAAQIMQQTLGAEQIFVGNAKRGQSYFDPREINNGKLDLPINAVIAMRESIGKFWLSRQKPLFEGKRQVSMFDMAKYLNKNLS